MIYRIRILLLAIIAMALLSSCRMQTVIANEESVSPATTQPTVQTENPWEFPYSSDMEVYYSTVDFSAEKIVTTTRIQLSEDDGHALIEQLNLYKNSITKNVLKSEFYSYYTIELSSKYSFVIDADLEDYSRDISYMFINVQQDGSVRQYGTYVDASLVTFLLERSE